jgi:hypothetical protein
MRLTPTRGTHPAVRAAIAVAGVGCALLSHTALAAASWQRAAPVDNGAPYGVSTKDAVAVGSNGMASILFFQQPSGGSGLSGTPFMIRRSAGAATAWSAPEPVTTDAGEVNGFSRPQLDAQGDGGTLGAFAFNPSGGGTDTVATRWPAGDAAPGAAGQMVCTSGGTPECATADPDVALDGDGNGYAVGSTLGGANGDVLFARTDPSTGAWEPAEVLAQGFYPQVAVDGSGDVVVTYQRADTSTPFVVIDRLYAKRQLVGDPGFGSEHQISGPNTVGGVTAVTIDGAGDATALFVEDSVPSIGPLPNAGVVQAVRWAHDSPAPDPEQQVSASASSEGNATAPSLAGNPQGDLIAAWQANNGPEGAIYAAGFSAGQWSSPEQLSPQDTNDSYSRPQVAIDSNGVATVVYDDTTPPPTSTTDVLAQRQLPSGVWYSPRSIGSQMPGAGSVVGDSVHIAAARPGQADVAFIQSLGGTNRLFARRFVDTTPPDTTTSGGPSGPTKDSTPTYHFASNEAGATFMCRIDSAAYAPCTSPHTTAPLANGSHNFYVRAVDAAGNSDPTPASRSFKVDTHAPSSQASAAASTHSSPFTVRYTTSDPSPSTGLAAVELWARRPGRSYSKVATDTTPNATRVFHYAPASGAGTYRFFTRARDHEVAPRVADGVQTGMVVAMSGFNVGCSMSTRPGGPQCAASEVT